MVKYVDSQTIILKFDMAGDASLGKNVETGKLYRVRATAITDVTGMYSSKYPDPGTTINLRAGKR
jgi:hypothetical protein